MTPAWTFHTLASGIDVSHHWQRTRAMSRLTSAAAFREPAGSTPENVTSDFVPPPEPGRHIAGGPCLVTWRVPGWAGASDSSGDPLLRPCRARRSQETACRRSCRQEPLPPKKIDRAVSARCHQHQSCRGCTTFPRAGIPPLALGPSPACAGILITALAVLEAATEATGWSRPHRPPLSRPQRRGEGLP
jgi:hypothetical protein